jgi:hypothetical protein
LGKPDKYCNFAALFGKKPGEKGKEETRITPSKEIARLLVYFGIQT